MWGNAFDIMPIFRFLGGAIIILLIAVIFLGYRSCSRDKYVAMTGNPLLVDTTINCVTDAGVKRCDTTYNYYKQK